MQAFRGLLAAGVRSGAVDQHASDDLSHKLDELTKAVADGKTEDLDRKISELQDKASEAVDKGEIREPFASRIEKAVGDLAAAVGASREAGD